MKCPRCGKRGHKVYNGFCSASHWHIHKRNSKVKLQCATCGSQVVRNRSAVPKSGIVYCIRCPKHTGENHPQWKEGQYIDPQGYRHILIGSEYKREHIHTWETENSACILNWMHGMIAVHHINMNKQDNRPENLVLLSSEDHGRIHRFIDAKRFDEAKCILMRYIKQQAFFLQHTEHIDFIESTSLQNILSLT